jgi:hypothetical protein
MKIKETISRLPRLSCGNVTAYLNEYLGSQCKSKKNQLKPCHEEAAHGGCGCGGASHATGSLVDLVILIDGSGSMEDAAKLVDKAATSALEIAHKKCPSDLRVTWLTVDNDNPGTTASGSGGWPGTNFTQTHEQYLNGIGVTGPYFHNATPQNDSPYNEQGADAVADLSKFYDWRPDACRAIFYISDTTLDAGWTQGADDTAATTNAISQALADQVTVFAHFVAPHQEDPTDVPATRADYQALCHQTGGTYYEGPVSKEQYVEILTDVVCHACGGCKEIKAPDLAPCVSISWGDSVCDCIETDDVEILCITLCNCYSNVTFENVVIGTIVVTDSAGNPVATLPDGTPSIQAIPIGPICFGSIGPCKDGNPTCVSREFVLRTRGAKGGGYQVHVRPICYSVTFHYQKEECFQVPICQD